MILISKDQTNSLTLTLSERCDLTNPYFLFYFRNKVSGEEFTCLLTDTSQFTDRFNRFSFIEPTTREMKIGFWMYEVYEQASASNLDRTLAYQMVESGVCKVIDVTSTTGVTTYAGQTTTHVVYE